MQPIKADVLKYLSDARAHYAAYHNHKEVSAWAGVLLYVIFATQIAFAPSELLKTDAAVCSAYLLVVILWLVVLLYLYIQLDLRRWAANCIGAALLLGTEYLTKEQKDIKAEDWSLKDIPDAGHHSPHVLPKIVFDKAQELDRKGHRARRWLEFAALAIVSISFVAAVSRVWFR